jgi:hypothetical protein
MTLMANLGFTPAYLDYATMTIYPSGFAASALIPGFERKGFFYTRTAAARV